VLQDRCREYAVITEPLNGLRLVVCGLNGFYRNQHVYTSRSNVVRLQMAAWPTRNPLSTSASGNDVTPARYVIHYEGSQFALLRYAALSVEDCIMHYLSVCPSVCPVSACTWKTKGSRNIKFDAKFLHSSCIFIVMLFWGQKVKGQGNMVLTHLSLWVPSDLLPVIFYRRMSAKIITATI